MIGRFGLVCVCVRNIPEDEHTKQKKLKYFYGYLVCLLSWGITKTINIGRELQNIITAHSRNPKPKQNITTPQSLAPQSTRLNNTLAFLGERKTVGEAIVGNLDSSGKKTGLLQGHPQLRWPHGQVLQRLRVPLRGGGRQLHGTPTVKDQT